MIFDIVLDALSYQKQGVRSSQVGAGPLGTEESSQSEYSTAALKSYRSGKHCSICVIFYFRNILPERFIGQISRDRSAAGSFSRRSQNAAADNS
jgi:hypothetical protein